MFECGGCGGKFSFNKNHLEIRDTDVVVGTAICKECGRELRLEYTLSEVKNKNDYIDRATELFDFESESITAWRVSSE